MLRMQKDLSFLISPVLFDESTFIFVYVFMCVWVPHLIL
jgi:hypothetical protein